MHSHVHWKTHPICQKVAEEGQQRRLRTVRGGRGRGRGRGRGGGGGAAGVAAGRRALRLLRREILWS